MDDQQRDELRDAIALMLSWLDNDVEAARVIADNCDLRGVLSHVVPIAMDGLVATGGEGGAREGLEHLRRWLLP